MQETRILSLSWGNPLEKEMATHSNILAWEIPWTEEPGGLQSMGSQRVRHDLATKQQICCLLVAESEDAESWIQRNLRMLNHGYRGTADKEADFHLCRGLASLIPELSWHQLDYQKR